MHGNGEKLRKKRISYGNTGISYGLAWLSGFNPYAALLALAVAARVSNTFPINPDLAFLTHNGFIFLLIALVILDFFAEKIPFVDQLWNAIHTIIRPLAAMVIMHALHYSPSPLEHVALLVSACLISIMAHSTKWALRLMATMGCAAPLISAAENIGTVIIIFLSFTNPVAMLTFVAIFT